jgi:hypothetical protein
MDAGSRGLMMPEVGWDRFYHQNIAWIRDQEEEDIFCSLM